MDTKCLLNYYEPVTEPANVIVPQVLAILVTSGGTTVRVVIDPVPTVSPSGTSSHTEYIVITLPASPLPPTVPLDLAINLIKELKYPEGPVDAV
jgi:hypothetical protein